MQTRAKIDVLVAGGHSTGKLTDFSRCLALFEGDHLDSLLLVRRRS